MKKLVSIVEIRLAGQKARRVLEAKEWLRVNGFCCEGCTHCEVKHVED